MSNVKYYDIFKHYKISCDVYETFMLNLFSAIYITLFLYSIILHKIEWCQTETINFNRNCVQ